MAPWAAPHGWVAEIAGPLRVVDSGQEAFQVVFDGGRLELQHAGDASQRGGKRAQRLCLRRGWLVRCVGAPIWSAAFACFTIVSGGFSQ